MNLRARAILVHNVYRYILRFAEGFFPAAARVLPPQNRDLTHGKHCSGKHRSSCAVNYIPMHRLQFQKSPMFYGYREDRSRPFPVPDIFCGS